MKPTTWGSRAGRVRRVLEGLVWQVQPQHNTTVTGQHLGACAPAAWTPPRLRIQGQRCPLCTRAATHAGHETHLTWMLWHLRFPLRREPPEGSGRWGGCSWGNGENEPQGPRSFSPACLHCDVDESLGTSGQMKTPTSWKDRASDFIPGSSQGPGGRRPRAAAARNW